MGAYRNLTKMQSMVFSQKLKNLILAKQIIIGKGTSRGAEWRKFLLPIIIAPSSEELWVCTEIWPKCLTSMVFGQKLKI